jgi:hypothetical protein
MNLEPGLLVEGVSHFSRKHVEIISEPCSFLMTSTVAGMRRNGKWKQPISPKLKADGHDPQVSWTWSLRAMEPHDYLGAEDSGISTAVRGPCDHYKNDSTALFLANSPTTSTNLSQDMGMLKY